MGIGCLSLSIASLALLISTQTRMSASGFKQLIYFLEPKGNLLTGCAAGLTSVFTCNLSWKLFNLPTPENRSARFLTRSTEAPSLETDYACGEFGGPTLNKFSFSAVSFPSRALPLTTFNNSKLIHTLFSRLFTMNFTFKSSNNLDWFGLAISKQLLFTLSGLALHFEESRPQTSMICFTVVPLE